MTGTTDDTNGQSADANSVKERASEDGALEEASFVEYGIEDKPPTGESVLLGFQHYLTMIGANIAVPLALAGAMEMPADQTAQFVGTFFVVSGLATLAQTTVGNRYPIVQGATFSMLAPALAIIGVIGGGWRVTLLELQGAVIAAAAVEVLVGYLGLMGRLKKYLSPVVIAPTIALIGLSLFNVPQITATNQNWWLVGLTVGLIVLFSQYLDNHRAFRLFPVLLGVVSAWLIAAILSVTGFYAPGTPGHVALGQVASADPIQPVMPLQWGMPRFTLPYIIGMFAGVVASMIESFGDYHAVARLSGVGAPSRKRIDHGIGMEGVASVFAGIMGTGNGSTSYSENIGAIGLTGVASRYVVQIGAVLMLVVGFVGYFGQLVATIPSPIVGGLFIAMFGQIAAVGLSNLKYVDLDSQRNLFIVGFAMFAGLAIPAYIGGLGTAEQSGAELFQQGLANVAVLGPALGTDLVANTLYVILGTGMAVGGFVAFFLDNTVEGTREERGLEAWDAITEDESDFESAIDRLGSGRGSDPTKAD
ncbi:Xanthine/uracil permease [Haladaptatus litoreus]|uniref:Xanthine/uracil permease n=1 Tax=Haladaptatus litoreus TaxID=553468 RepID=A0A1N6XSY0_9EURY|nr:solute carrier family 23 protein [Haladaptatus litoreus]SIR05339.1 Xanthine/uracil permease [Haladaptatus litoreus]